VRKETAQLYTHFDC